MTTSAKISKNFVSTLIGMGQPLETFCNKNLSIPFFLPKFLSYWCFLLSFCNKTMWMQDGILWDCMSVVLDRSYVYDNKQSEKTCSGKISTLWETLLQLLIDVTVKYFLTISTIAKSINFTSHLFDFFSQHPIFITQVFYICRLNWCKVFI